jgi:DNA integrity scanning protein DisA with diadenylate cyclase activity
VGDLFANLQSSVRLIDLLDIGIVAFIVYRILLLIKGTRAMQMLTGLGILGIGFYLSLDFRTFYDSLVVFVFF